MWCQIRAFAELVFLSHVKLEGIRLIESRAAPLGAKCVVHMVPNGTSSFFVLLLLLGFLWLLLYFFF